MPELFSTIDIFPTLCSLTGIPARLEAISGDPDADFGTRLKAEWNLDYYRNSPGVDHARNLLGEPDGPDPESVFIMHISNMHNTFTTNYEDFQPFRGVVTKEYVYAASPEEEYCLFEKSDEYQDFNLLIIGGYLEERLALREKVRQWMESAEKPYLDRWFDEMPQSEIDAWYDPEMGNGDRETGDRGDFDLSKSDPKTGVEGADGLPEDVMLHQNFPNPFNNRTTIRFVLDREREVELGVYNMAGEHMETVAGGKLAAGEHRIPFDVSGYPSGVYYYRLKAGLYTATRKMTLIK